MRIKQLNKLGRFSLGLFSALEVHLIRTCNVNCFLRASSKSDLRFSTYVQVCTQLRNLRFFMHLRKIAKTAWSTIFPVHLRFLAVRSLVNGISRKRVADFTMFAKTAKIAVYETSLVLWGWRLGECTGKELRRFCPSLSQTCLAAWQRPGRFIK